MYRSLKKIQEAINLKQLSVKQIVEHYIEKAETNKHLNAIVEVFYDSLDKAQHIDNKINQGKAGRLAGMVIAIKDNISYKDHNVSAASKILGGFKALYTATALERLIAEDAIIIGRSNCDEFAMGSATDTSYYGPTKNPIDITKVPGGSSGGSAAAVKAGLCLAALGTDTGGSVRQPAAFCDVVGLKPTYGRISRYGVIAFASSFDQIGIFANNIEDTATILEVIAGKDQNDDSSSSEPVQPYKNLLQGNKNFKIAYSPKTLDYKDIDQEISIKTKATLDKIKSNNFQVQEIDFPYLDYVLPAYYIISSAEASSNLARYDGLRYGFRAKDVHSLEDTYKRTRSIGFGSEVKRRIILGTFVLSSGYYDAYYTKAQKVRQLITLYLNSILEKHDFIVLPTSPTTPWLIGQKDYNGSQQYIADIYTVIASLAGLPAISITIGQHSNKMPIALQIISGKFQEAKLLAFANYLYRNEA